MKRNQFIQGKQDCEYKYVVCREEMGQIKVLRWEEGPNRCISFCQNKSLKIFLSNILKFYEFKNQNKTKIGGYILFNQSTNFFLSKRFNSEINQIF